MNARISFRSFSSGGERLGLHLRHQRQQHVERVVVAGVEDLFLVLEVVIEIPLRHLERRGDLVDARAVIAAAAERGGGALENLDAPIGAVRGFCHLVRLYHGFERSFKLV